MSDDLKIVGLLCNWCCYGGADTAGTARMQYSPNIRIIRVICSGRINPSMIFKAFQEGADGVFVGGCHIGDCHYDAATTNGQEDQKLLRTFLKSLELKRKGSVMNGFQHLKVRNFKEPWRNSINPSQNWVH